MMFALNVLTFRSPKKGPTVGIRAAAAGGGIGPSLVRGWLRSRGC